MADRLEALVKEIIAEGLQLAFEFARFRQNALELAHLLDVFRRRRLLGCVRFPGNARCRWWLGGSGNGGCEEDPEGREAHVVSLSCREDDGQIAAGKQAEVLGPTGSTLVTFLSGLIKGVLDRVRACASLAKGTVLEVGQSVGSIVRAVGLATAVAAVLQTPRG
ncbi:hypothetical protein HUA78_30435 [Myxococcus sp. CA033]|uniref:hypothetical protein n=1 Tax=Myxococcus sp. CA033 TaxID=2741516 RepID=UPI00157A6515|nr:hypothetical protein [Myxococcus sp. CA033]NTX38771.1 hypothetical protein [Myxococcus sp. CA033]